MPWVRMKRYLEYAWKGAIFPLHLIWSTTKSVSTYHRQRMFAFKHFRFNFHHSNCSSDYFAYLTSLTVKQVFSECLHNNWYIFQTQIRILETEFDEKALHLLKFQDWLVHGQLLSDTSAMYLNTHKQGQHVLKAHRPLLYLASMLAYDSKQCIVLIPLRWDTIYTIVRCALLMRFFSVISAAYLYSTRITMEVTTAGENFCVFK